jgi:hypothetical protein
MKVLLNLAVAPSARQRYALAWAVPVTLLALAGLAFLSVATGRRVREYREVRREAQKLQDQEAEFNRAEQDLRKELEQPRLRSLFRETQYVNKLIDRKRVSVTTLTERVAKLLPVSVRLTGLSLAQQDQDRVVRFAVAGSGEEVVENFLINLENAPDFKDVGNVNWGFGQEGGASIQVIVTCTARYVGGEAE